MLKMITNRLFGGIKMTWPKVIGFAVIMAVYTAACALLAPDGNSFHDIAVVMSPWVLPALIVILNCEKPWEAAAKVFVFFLVSQPLIYLFQVPFSDMGWKLFGYYPYWFKLTLATIPAGFAAWFCKKGNILSAVILSGAIALMALEGLGFLKRAINDFPNGILSAIVILGLIPVFIFGILKTSNARLVAGAVSLLLIVALAYYSFVINKPSDQMTEIAVNSEYGITVKNMDKSKIIIDKGGDDIVSAKFSENDGMCYVKLKFKKQGKTGITFVNPKGEKHRWKVSFEVDHGNYIIGHEIID